MFLVPANHDPAGTRSYQYEAQVTGIAESPGARPVTAGASLANRVIVHRGGAGADLVDAAGRPQARLEPGSNDVSAVAPGVYFLMEQGSRVQGFKGARVRKVVIQH